MAIVHTSVKKESGLASSLPIQRERIISFWFPRVSRSPKLGDCEMGDRVQKQFYQKYTCM